MKIKIPSTIGVEINNIEQQILQLFPSINSNRKELSKIYTERILIFLNELRKSVLHNEQLYLNNRISEDSIKYAQICKTKRIRVFGESRDTDYTDEIQEKVLLKIVAIRPYEHPTLGFVDHYVPHKLCKQYYFIKEPEAYIDYELTTKKGIQIAKALTGIDIKNRDLSRENNEVRRTIISNTDKIFLDYNSSSKEILRHRLRNVRTTPKEYSNAFNNNQFKTLTDDFGHRLHHKLTTLKTELFPHLYVQENNEDDMERVVTLDLVCSQPFFISAFSEQFLNRLVKDNPKMNYLKTIIPIVKKYEGSPDFIKYKQLCTDGEIYEYISERYQNMFGVKTERKTMKKILFRAFFSDYTKHGAYKRKDIKRSINVFKTNFPTMYSMFKEIQGLNLKQKVLQHPKYGQESRKNTAFLLQRIESCVMLNYIVPKILEKHQNIWCSMVHDCIVIRDRVEDIRRVKEVMVDTFNDLGIVPPQIKVK